jgi:uncharacterized SAM-binding protein YcdF (DUF218 family)
VSRGSQLRVSAVLLLLAVASVGIFAFRHLGEWLELDEPLRPSKAIVVMGGGIPFRVMEAADLFKAHWAGEIWLTQGAVQAGDAALARIGLAPETDSDFDRAILSKLGVPNEAIRVIPDRVENTLAEEKAILRFAGPALQAPLILVTSKFHTRRTRVIWNLTAGKDAPAIVRYTAEEPYDAARWWSNSADALATFKELFGILNARAGFPISPREH